VAIPIPIASPAGIAKTPGGLRLSQPSGGEFHGGRDPVTLPSPRTISEPSDRPDTWRALPLDASVSTQLRTAIRCNAVGRRLPSQRPKATPSPKRQPMEGQRAPKWGRRPMATPVRSERFLVTVHREDCPALTEIRRRYRKRERSIDQPSLLLHRVVDGLVDSFFPSLAELDDRIDELEDAIFLKADETQLQEIFQMKRLLVGMRKTVTPQRDAFATLMGGVAELPGLTEDDEHYFRDVYDHLIRISDLIDSYRDLLTGAMDVYLSTVSNRTNAVMKQLTIIATIFLPLTFITGFFGQNFDWMVSHVHSGPMFLVLGVGSEIVALLALLAFFRRRGWF
jgi:magnesium/cobalt transport protein CorA